MLPIYTPILIVNKEFLDLNMIFNQQTLNIFSDASMKKIKKKGNILASCYGALAICENYLVDEMFRIQSVSTVPAAELRGIRCSLSLAMARRDRFPVINIFSDSLYSIHSIRDYANDWIWDNKNQYYKYNNMHPNHTRPIQNQDLIYECIALITELRKTNVVNIFHQRGHVTDNMKKEALDAFKLYNGFTGIVSFDVIDYISYYNNMIDDCSRKIVTKMDKHQYYCDPISFKPNPSIYLNY